MVLSSWVQGLRARIRNRRASRDLPVTPRQSIQTLESRTLLTTTGVLVGTELSVFADGGDDIVVQHDSTTGNVIVLANGSRATGVPSVASASITALNVITGDGDNVIDVFSVSAVDFPLLTSLNIESGGGSDIVFGSFDLSETIQAGDGDDSVLVFWRQRLGRWWRR